MKATSFPGALGAALRVHGLDTRKRPLYPASPAPLLSSTSSSSVFPSSSIDHSASSDFFQLQQDIEQFLADELPDENHRRLVSGFISKLESQIREQYPTAELKTHGSGACGLATKTSDVDLVLSGVEPSDLVGIFRCLSRHYPDGCAEGVFSAKIPIVRILDPDSGQDADISVAEVSTPNVDHDYRTRLLRSYVKLDSRAVALIILVKKWSKLRDIGEARFGFLGSFGYSLSVINYLQSVSPPVLPCLHVNRSIPSGVLEPYDVLDYREYVPLESWQSQNTQSVASLLLGYFEWFASLPPGTAGNMSVRCGGVVNGAFVDMEVQKQKRCLCIEDPYQPDLNVGKGVSMEKTFIIKKELKQVARYMQDTKSHVRLKDLLIAATPNPRAPYDHGKVSARAWSQRKQVYRLLASAEAKIAAREGGAKRQRSPIKIASFDDEDDGNEAANMPYGPIMKSVSRRHHPYARPPPAFASSRIQTLSSRFSQQSYSQHSYSEQSYSQHSYSQAPPATYYSDQTAYVQSAAFERVVPRPFVSDAFGFRTMGPQPSDAWRSVQPLQAPPVQVVRQPYSSNPNRRVVLKS